jgi:hypothetical protein
MINSSMDLRVRGGAVKTQSIASLQEKFDIVPH